jgi:hypothetical protein
MNEELQPSLALKTSSILSTAKLRGGNNIIRNGLFSINDEKQLRKAPNKKINPAVCKLGVFFTEALFTSGLFTALLSKCNMLLLVITHTTP